MTAPRRQTHRVLGAAVAAGALVASIAGSAAGVGTPVRPGPDLGAWKLVAEGATGSGDARRANTSGWLGAAAAQNDSGAVLLRPTTGATTAQRVVASLHSDTFAGTNLNDITSLNVRYRTTTPGAGPYVRLEAERVGGPENCTLLYLMPLSSTWSTADLLTGENWRDDEECFVAGGGTHTWDDLKGTGVANNFTGFRIELAGLDGIGGVRIQSGATDNDPYADTLVDWFELNADTQNFEAPTISLSGATASIPAGGSISLPLAAQLSGPNQPTTFNSINVITADGGQTSSATVNVTSNPAGLCTAGALPVSFAPQAGGQSISQPRTQVLSSLNVTTKAGTGGTCTIALASPVNATVAGAPVTLTVTATPSTGSTPPPKPGPVTTCVAKAVSKKSKIKVDMGPDLPGSGSYKFRLDVKKKGEWFRYLKFATTQGAKETRTVNVPKGKYRAKCYGPTQAQDSRSKVVKIKK